MFCYDIIFPLNLGPLTYRCPDQFKGIAEPGMLVSAPLKKSTATGIIYRKASSPPKRVREFTNIIGSAPIFGKDMLKLISWMSDYYLASEGLILKQVFPREIFTRTKQRKSAIKTYQHSVGLHNIEKEDLKVVSASIAEKAYRAFLFKPPSSIYEYSYAASLLKEHRNVVVLVPEISHADLFYSLVKDLLHERACILHSRLSAGVRSSTIEGIISGKHDIVIGTRAALFAPLKNISLIIILHEHSSYYKLEEGIRFNIRDAAIMRGYIEKAVVLLSSPTPSIESWFNAITGKYQLLHNSYSSAQPKVKIIDIRYGKTIKPYLSKAVYDDVKKHLAKKGRVMFVLNRRGYSTAFHCADCGNTEICPECTIPLVLHKESNLLKCHYCSKTIKVPESCNKCSGHRLELLGAGTERIQEDIVELFGVNALRFDSDAIKTKSEIKEIMEDISSDNSRVIIGTKMMTSRMGPAEKYTMAAILNIDTSLGLPDFRAQEKAFREFSSIKELVDPNGEIQIQTKFPQNSIFKHFKSNNYDAFVREELELRKALGYPPYAKLMNITFTGKPEMADRILRILDREGSDIEILGPTERKNSKNVLEYSFLLKSLERRKLHHAAKTILESFSDKKVDIRIDIDPY